MKEGPPVEDRNVWISVTLVALVGGVIAFLYTERGRESLKRMEGSVEDFSRSLHQLRDTIQKASQVAAQGIEVATESMEVVAGLIGKGSRQGGSATLH